MFLFCQFFFPGLTMSSPTRESVLGLYADFKSAKGEGHPAKTRHSAFPGFVGHKSNLLYYLRKKLRFEPDLLKSCSDDNTNTGIGDVGDDGRQKSLLSYLTERRV